MKNTGKTYEVLTDTTNANSRIVRMRELHREIDAAVMRAHGWDDFDFRHGYHEQLNLAENDRVRFTISEPARAEVLRRFAELNRQRYEEEQASAPAAKPRASKRRTWRVPTGQGALAFVDVPATTSKAKSTAPAKNTSTQRTSK